MDLFTLVTVSGDCSDSQSGHWTMHFVFIHSLSPQKVHGWKTVYTKCPVCVKFLAIVIFNRRAYEHS